MWRSTLVRAWVVRLRVRNDFATPAIDTDEPFAADARGARDAVVGESSDTGASVTASVPGPAAITETYAALVDSSIPDREQGVTSWSDQQTNWR